MRSVIQVQTTTQDKPSAQAIAENLVTQQLAACVQIDGPITSVYRWQGSVETAQEWRCSMKTVRSLWPEVEDRIRRLHSYEEPEIIVTDIVDGSQSYLDWLCEQLRVAQ